MRFRHLGIASVIITVGVLGLACSKSKSGDTPQIMVNLTPDGCDPATLTARAGPTTFVVTNKDAGNVTEFEIMSNGKIIGEVENVSKGLTKKFTINLKVGSFDTACPGGKTNAKGTLSVSESADAVKDDPELVAAAQTYRTYVKGQTDQLLAGVKALQTAIATGNVDSSKQAYIAARPFYERIEPVAESFGDLDPAIDERADDKPADKLSGFHRIEYVLWANNTTTGLAPIADQLVADVQKLQKEVETLDVDVLDTANGAVDLLGEVTASKITGEEERYSRTDLSDFQANVEGAKAAYESLKPVLLKRNATLATTLDGRFADVFTALEPYKKNGVFVPYTDLTAADTKKLGQVIDTLAEPMSKVAEALSKPAK